MRTILKQERKRLGLSQQAMANKLGISLRYYAMIEQGVRTGDFEIWDELENITGIHQKKLRQQDTDDKSADTESDYVFEEHDKIWFVHSGYGSVLKH